MAVMMLRTIAIFSLCSLPLSGDEEEAGPNCFELFKGKANPHPLLTQADHWVKEDGMGFDSMNLTRYQRFKDGQMTRWSRKTPADDIDPDTARKMKETVSKKKQVPYQAWHSLIMINGHIETYTIDSRHLTMFTKVFIKTGEHSWFEGSKSLKGSSEENLYQFDRCPFDNNTGHVFHRYRRKDLNPKEPLVKSVTREAFSTDHQKGEDYDVWVIRIGPPDSSKHLFRIKWHNGPDIFSPTNYHTHGGWKAIIKPQDLEPQPNPENQN